MADWGRGGGGSRGRVGTWDDAERRRRAFIWPDSLPGLKFAAEQFRNWAIADTGPGRLLPWLPVAFGLGMALYFAVDREPAWWAGSGLAALCCVIAFVARRRPIALPVMLAFTAVAAGFAVATLKSVRWRIRSWRGRPAT